MILDAAGFSAFDDAFASLALRLHLDLCPERSESAPEVAAWARQASRAVSGGHVCVDVARAAAGPAQAAQALAALQSSPLVGRDAPGRPLVLSSGRLYLERYWRCEQDLGRALRELGALRCELDPARATAVVDRWCGPQSGMSVEQRRAGVTVLSRRLTVISGGPGTGKTTTVARALQMLSDYHGADYRVALAAPTGKAAARLTQVLSEIDCAPAPREAVTLHRLLGLRGGGLSRRVGQRGPLPVDCLVIDEASMLDLALAAAVTRALPRHARLVLIGDHDQLASVEAGAVMASICAEAGQISVEQACVLSTLTGEPVQGDAGASLLADCIVTLRHSYRFAAGGSIGALASCVREGNGAAAAEVLARGGAVRWQPNYTSGSLADEAMQGYASYLAAVRARRPVEEVFARAEEFRVLCALRAGPFGVMGLNAEIERRIRKAALGQPGDWYAGRMVMVTVNDYGARLSNGDVGIALSDASGGLNVYFRDARLGFRAVAPSRLPAHESGFVVTIHKSQGSEFAHVLAVLPPEPSVIATRELLYTAVTRARNGLTLACSRATIDAAIAAKQWRDSGLNALLQRSST